MTDALPQDPARMVLEHVLEASRTEGEFPRLSRIRGELTSLKDALEALLKDRRYLTRVSGKGITQSRCAVTVRGVIELSTQVAALEEGGLTRLFEEVRGWARAGEIRGKVVDLLARAGVEAEHGPRWLTTLASPALSGRVLSDDDHFLGRNDSGILAVDPNGLARSVWFSARFGRRRDLEAGMPARRWLLAEEGLVPTRGKDGRIPVTYGTGTLVELEDSLGARTLWAVAQSAHERVHVLDLQAAAAGWWDVAEVVDENERALVASLEMHGLAVGEFGFSDRARLGALLRRLDLLDRLAGVEKRLRPRWAADPRKAKKKLMRELAAAAKAQRLSSKFGPIKSAERALRRALEGTLEHPALVFHGPDFQLGEYFEYRAGTP